MKHVILLHYYCESEIKCYLNIADFLSSYSRCNSEYEFLLLCSSFIQPSESLHNAFLKISTTRTVHCKNSKPGHAEGCTAGFWEGMEYINSNYEKDGGFVLWLEADTMPAKSNWVDLLEQEWAAHPRVLAMGLYVPGLKGVLSAHINGGACYPKNLVESIPSKYKTSNPIVDVNMSQYILPIKRYHKSRKFVFSRLYNLCNDITDPEIVILNGYAQNREEFISKGVGLFKNPVFLEKEKNRLKRFPLEGRKCCWLWDASLSRCYIHDYLKMPHKRIISYRVYALICRCQVKLNDLLNSIFKFT
jgi:hypothetical protein